MKFFSKSAPNSVVLDKAEKSRKYTSKQVDYVFCAGIALMVGYTYAKYLS